MSRKPDIRLLAVSEWISETRAGGRCECDGLCGRTHNRLFTDIRCPNRLGHNTVEGGTGTVALIVDRVDELAGDTDTNLIALCQHCSKRHRNNLAQAAAERAEQLSIEAQHNPLF